MEVIAQLVSQLISLVLFLGASIGLNFASVEGVKYLVALLNTSLDKVRWLQKPFNYLTLSGKKTFLFSIVMAFILIAGFDVDMFGDFSAFEGVDPMYAKLIQTALVSLGANAYNDRQKS